jgi:hypothetical protein
MRCLLCACTAVFAKLGTHVYISVLGTEEGWLGTEEGGWVLRKVGWVLKEGWLGTEEGWLGTLSIQPTFLSPQPTFLVRGCVFGQLKSWWKFGPPPPLGDQRGGVWQENITNHHLQCSQVSPPPHYLGRGEGCGQQQDTQQQHQYCHPRPSTHLVRSMPLLLPPYCIKCSVLVWRGALELSRFASQWAGKW